MKKERFMRKRERIIVIIVLFAVTVLATDSYAKEKKHGSQLVIQKEDGQIIKAELLAVKESKLILIDSVSLSGMTLDIKDIKSIRIAKKSKFFQGLGYGLLIGGGSGALLGFLSGDDDPGWFSFKAGQKAMMGGLAFGILGTSTGGIWGAIKGIDETINLEGRSPEYAKLILKKLNSKSRFPKELPRNFKELTLMLKKEIKNSVENEESLENQIQFKEKHLQGSSSPKFSRIHFTFKPGYFNSQGINDYVRLFKNFGFGDTKPGGKATFLWFSFGSYGPTDFPRVAKDPVIYFGDIKIEYSINQKFAIGIGYAPLGEHEIHGYKYILLNRKGKQYYTNLFLIGNFSGAAYYLSCSWMPIPDAFLKKSSFKLGAGIGLNALSVNFKTSQYEHSEVESDNIIISKKDLVFMGFAEYDYYFNRHWSFGVNAEYKYAPTKIKAFQLTGYYDDLDEQNNLIVSSMLIDIPGHKVNFGGFGFGINFGLHL